MIQKTNLCLPNLASALVPCLSTAVAESTESLERFLLLSNLAGRLVEGAGRKGKRGTDSLRSEVLALIQSKIQ